ncbi:uncharacterized protein CLUP02_07448 [Colletotrichum lupini]|uniref:Uncharacterized protein n=1 Tax=Colletotrichum lupini TaxID=145971 RepID=A0A9Q8SSV2_9PEZI|nr:uncharacterized protein CLUP02_07448 [Colletotrichum lupini]UQC81962.1 hypothetical protein CLUP02_07448 [Colletotrichum lupini]
MRLGKTQLVPVSPRSKSELILPPSQRDLCGMIRRLDYTERGNHLASTFL